MSGPRHFAMNACDYCIFAQDRVGFVPDGVANLPYMMVDLEGHVPRESLRAALVQTLQAHPAAMASLSTSPLHLRPRWRLPSHVAESAQIAADRALRCDDLTEAGDWAEMLEGLCQERYVQAWDLRAGPQVRLELYALPHSRARLVIRWPHYFMDAEGAQWFLARLDDRFLSGSDSSHLSDPASRGLAPDQDRVHVLRDVPFLRRIGMARRGLAGPKLPKHAVLRPLVDATGQRLRDFRYIHQHWDASEFARIRGRAKSATSIGPALYARYFAGCVCRAQHRLHQERGVPTEVYLITLPLQVGVSVPERRLLASRPLPGNYLVAPMICLTAEEAESAEAADRAILRQLEAFLAAQEDLCQWAALELAASLHHWCYDWIFKLPLLTKRYSSGFSYYGEIPEHLKSLGGAAVRNIWGGGPTTTPPAWNPVFSRFGERLNLSLTYTRPAISDELACRYLELIRAEVLGPT